MAFPVVEGTTSGTRTNDTGDTTITIPASVSAGELLLTIISQAEHTTEIKDPSSGDQWTRFFHVSEGSTFGDDSRLAAFWKLADGDEGGTTRTFDSFAQTCWACYRISGATDPTSQPPEVSGKVTDITVSPNPPSFTPSGGPKDFLWIPITGSTRNPETATSAPADYGSLVTKTTGAQTDNSEECNLATAHQTARLSTEDPGHFSYANTHRWIAATIAVHPAQDSAGGGVDIGFHEFQ